MSPTHLANCVWCEEQTGCCKDEHVLGLGGGCEVRPILEFCSLECFLALKAAVVQRESIAREMYPHWAWPK